MDNRREDSRKGVPLVVPLCPHHSIPGAIPQGCGRGWIHTGGSPNSLSILGELLGLVPPTQQPVMLFQLWGRGRWERGIWVGHRGGGEGERRRRSRKRNRRRSTSFHPAGDWGGGSSPQMYQEVLQRGSSKGSVWSWQIPEVPGRPCASGRGKV